MPMVKRLTKTAVENLPLPPKEQGMELYWDQSGPPGFGIRIGWAGARTYILQTRGRRFTLGRHGPFTVDMARERACRFLVEIADGKDPRAERRKVHAKGLTVGAALEAHIERLLAKGGSQRSAADVRYVLKQYLKAWTGRPLASLSRQECHARHREISTENGPYIANKTFRVLRAAWNTAARKHEDLPSNPVVAVDFNKERRRQEPIPWARLPAWRKDIEAFGRVRVDYLLTAIFLGLRSEDCATIRWDDLDTDGAILRRPRPKGGPDRAFEVPVPAVVMEIFKRRKKENVDDAGWVFPCRAKTGKVKPLVYRRFGRRAGETPHRLRDTYSTACVEAGLHPFDLDVLTNHRSPKGSVSAGYVRQNLEHLRGAQEKVAAYILGKMAGAPTSATENVTSADSGQRLAAAESGVSV